MPKFLGVHKMGSFDEEKLKKAQGLPKDEFGVTHENIIYNKEEDKLFCLLDAPDKDSVDKHHHKLGLSCDWIMEVKTTA
ncbi:MAG TPA: nickel-binding protein [Candidatus Nitrosocosmicus sp.]|nr:nickel-binding protein [Candidatus Nitrosocosmicus sp.]